MTQDKPKTKIVKVELSRIPVPRADRWQRYNPLWIGDPIYFLGDSSWDSFLALFTRPCCWLQIRTGKRTYPMFCWAPPQGNQYYQLGSRNTFLGSVPCDSQALCIIPFDVLAALKSPKAPSGVVLPPSEKLPVADFKGLHWQRYLLLAG